MTCKWANSQVFLNFMTSQRQAVMKRPLFLRRRRTQSPVVWGVDPGLVASFLQVLMSIGFLALKYTYMCVCICILILLKTAHIGTSFEYFYADSFSSCKRLSAAK